MKRLLFTLLGMNIITQAMDSNLPFQRLKDAAAERDIARIEHLLKDNPELSAHINDQDEYGNTILSIALASQYDMFDVPRDTYAATTVALTQTLLAAGANPNQFAPNSLSPLINAICSQCSIEATRALLRAGANPNVGYQGYMPLYYASSSCSEIMQLLLAAGAAIDTQDPEGNTTLHKVCTFGDLEGVQLLLRYNANRAITNHAGQTPYDVGTQNIKDYFDRLAIGPIIRAQMKGAESTFKDLDKYTTSHIVAHFVMGDRLGWTELHYAVQRKIGDLIEYLIQKKDLNVNACDTKGNTPLHIAAAINGIEDISEIHTRTNVIMVLLENGADINTQNHLGKTPLDVATPAVAKIIRDYRAAHPQV